jgi:tRNA nucleotidyltransferase (CCA-adding enzyme)
LLPADGRRDLLLLAVGLEGGELRALAAWLDGLGFPAGDRDRIVAAAVDAADAAARLREAGKPSEIAAVLAGEPVELVALAGALGAEAPARRWLAELRHVTLEISGEDLLATGVPQGAAIGRALAAALRAKLDGEATGRDAELAAALAVAT